MSGIASGTEAGEIYIYSIPSPSCNIFLGQTASRDV